MNFTRREGFHETVPRNETLMNLLIVDDHLTNLELLRAQLEAEGHAVFEAHDGVEALELLDRQQVDVAISDILMPRMDGYRLCHEIRTNTRLRNLPIIIYTCTYASPRDEKLALDLGADKYLKKPASIETIVAAVHEVIGMPHAAPRPEALQEVEVLKEYSERLVAKLQERNTELSAAVERYDDLFDNAHDLIQSLTPDGHFLYVNRTWCETLGYSEAEAPGLTMFDILHPDSRTHCLELFQRVFSGEHIDRIEATLTTKTGHTIVVEGTINCKVVEGKVVAVRCLFRDITERKRSEQALRNSDEKFRQLAGNITDVFYMTSPDMQQMHYVSPAYENIWGRSTANLYAHPQEWAEAILPEDRERVWATFGTLAAEGPSVSVEFRIARPDGDVRWILSRGFQVRDAAGKVIRITGIASDITERKQAEAEAQRSQQRLRDLIDGVGPSIFVGLMTPQGILIECNRPALAAACLKPEDVLGKPFVETPWWCHLPEAQRQLREAIVRAARGEASRYDVQVRAGENQFIEVDFSLQPIRDETGEVVFLVPSASVITERKQAEKSLRASQTNMATAQRIAHFGSWELELANSNDADANSLRWSDEMFRIAGYEPGTIEVSNDLFFRLVHPDDREPVRQAMAAAIRERRQYSIVHRLIRPDGDERVVQEMAQIFFDEKSGQPLKIVGTAADITERKRVEEQLKASFKEIFDLKAAQDEHAIVAITDPQGKITYVNDKFCAISKYSREELMGQDHRIINSSFHPKEFIRELWTTITHGKVWKGEIKNKAKDGSFYWVYTTIVPFLDEQGKPRQYVAIRADITERKLAEAALEKAHQELVAASRQAGMAEVATGVLHNVGNVLNSVNVASSCVADSIRKSKAANLSKVVGLMREHEANLGAFFTDHPKGKQIPGYLAQLAEHLSTEQAGALKELGALQKNIDHIKDIVTMQQSFAKTSGVTETLKVTDLVEDALRMNSSSFARHDIQVSKEFENVPPVTVEKHKVLQILVNLVCNGKQACDDSGRQEKRLTIRVSQQGEAARITVSDNGIGIPPENLTCIFAHGFTTKTNGHGFGLHSSALAAKELGGSLSAYSDGPGRGATFILELPLKHESKGLLCTT
jgi:PAS domain S-box-containing protein